ncbi:unnamed protein product [Ranitomeya imitator]|uniref:RNA transcription, translation and transport factor protein n=1 Tax=Ranitomeya imitator TaxID=111125 RepID=A0ABN9M5E4_9NEOB|nr:unnamed protein product [Ranitomeya imitator]
MGEDLLWIHLGKMPLDFTHSIKSDKHGERCQRPLLMHPMILFALAAAAWHWLLQGLPVALDKHTLGFDTGDAVLNDAARILRLLHVEELRELQTKINEAIVAVQAIIAIPRPTTD